MKILLMVFLCAAVALLGTCPLPAQNSVDVLNNGPQPPDAPMKAIWSPTSNGSRYASR
jgi:hypothetical protein